MNKELEYPDFNHEMQMLCNKYETIHCDEGLNYNHCADFKKEAEAIGYTFSYGLDAEPFEFRKLKN